MQMASNMGRQSLPEPAEDEPSLNLWTLVKDFIGKDIQSLPLPLSLHEPTTEMMKAAEDMEHSSLLDEAAALPAGSIERLLRVAAFALAPYATGGAPQRARKPFDGMLGETYMLEANGVRFIAEQVHVKPYAGAVRMEGRAWAIDEEVQPKPLFWGTTVDINLNWLLRLTFADGDAYEWRKVTSTINGILQGPSKVYLSHRGELIVRSLASGLAAHIKFPSSGKRLARSVEGFITADGRRLDFPRLHGSWDDKLVAEAPDGAQQVLWQKSAAPVNPSRWQAPTSFFFRLNEMPEELKARLPPSDSRWRADVRAMEEGRYSTALVEHRKLCVRDGARVKALRAGGRPLHAAHMPAWFELLDVRDAPGVTPPGQHLRYRFKQGQQSFWSAYERGDWGACPNLFDL